jgi:hypothetical protein
VQSASPKNEEWTLQFLVVKIQFLLNVRNQLTLHTKDCHCVDRRSLLASLSNSKEGKKGCGSSFGKGKGPAVLLQAMKT